MLCSQLPWATAEARECGTLGSLRQMAYIVMAYIVMYLGLAETDDTVGAVVARFIAEAVDFLELVNLHRR